MNNVVHLQDYRQRKTKELAQRITDAMDSFTVEELFKTPMYCSWVHVKEDDLEDLGVTPYERVYGIYFNLKKFRTLVLHGYYKLRCNEVGALFLEKIERS